MAMLDACVICCSNYNLSTRRPWDLGCGHCVCEQCYNASKLALCVECRQPVNNPHLQYTLLRMLQPGSPTSFPIGLGAVDADDEAPGTPHPSAPVMEVEPWEPESDTDSRRGGSQRSSSTGSLRCNPTHPAVAQQPHRLSQQSSYNSLHNSSSGTLPRPMSPTVPTAPALATPFYPLPLLGHQSSSLEQSSGAATPTPTRHVPAHALEFSSTAWATTAADGAVTLGLEVTAATSDSLVSHQSFLTSFPVEDFDLLECLPESPTSSQADGEAQDSLEADVAAENERPAVNRALGVVQGAVGSCAVLMQQLLVPHVLFEQGPRHGWPAPGPSLILATTSSSWRTWGAYSTAMHHTLSQCNQLQLLLVSKLGQGLHTVGLPNSGHLAAYMLATWVLGMLLYHWGLGLQLLPIATAALGLLSFGVMSSSSGGCSLWPAKLAGALVTGDCLLVGFLGLIRQQLGLGAAMHARLLAATPQLLLVALLLMWAQVALEVISMGWANYKELKFASLVARCWGVAAAAVLFGSPSTAAAVALAAIPWVQKLHLLLEAPVIVHHLGLLLQSSTTCWPQQPAEAAAAAAAADAASSTSNGAGASCRRRSRGTAGSMRRFDSVRSEAEEAEAHSTSVASSSRSGAWLLSVHILVQLSLLLFVPPAPLAAVSWLPFFVRNSLVWVSRVLLCGCVMQLVLHTLSGNTQAGTTQQQVNNRSSAQGRGSSCTEAVGPISNDNNCSSNTNCTSIRNRRMTGRAQSRLGGCSVDTDSCRPSSSCSAGAQDCMMLAPRANTPFAGHSGWGLHRESNTGDSIGSSNSHSLWGLVLAEPVHTQLDGVGHSSRSGIIVGAAAVFRQHVMYFVLLFLAAAGDSFIMAVPSAAGAVRAAWHSCVQQMLVVMFLGEFVMALWHECLLLRYQHRVVAADMQAQGTGQCSSHACTP